MFLAIRTHAEGPPDSPTITSQTVDIRVYQRQDGREKWGWYAVRPKYADAGSVAFDGRHLRIRNGPLVLNVTFHAEAGRWTGTWQRDGRVREVVLERPRPRLGVVPSRWLGTWEGVGRAAGPTVSGRLHISQSSDGTLTVWMDRIRGLIDQRHGELLQLVSADREMLTLETTSAGGPRDRYEGKLSADGSMLVGRWASSTPGRTLDAPQDFRRIR